MSPKVVILGARGSVPVSSEEFLCYGGATTCVLIQSADQTIILDAGTGMLMLPTYLKPEDTDISLLLSHGHVDHLLGFSMCPSVFDSARSFHIYAAERSGSDGESYLQSLMSPPLWPIRPSQVGAKVCFHPLAKDFQIGPIQVDSMEGIHPGGVSLFRLTIDGRRIVFITDCTLTDSLFPRAAEFAQNCDLLLCDGQYSEKEWQSHSSFGHNTWTTAARLGAACDAKQVRIIHHDPFHTDRDLDAASAMIKTIHPRCMFARAGEEIIL